MARKNPRLVMVCIVRFRTKELVRSMKLAFSVKRRLYGSKGAVEQLKRTLPVS